MDPTPPDPPTSAPPPATKAAKAPKTTLKEDTNFIRGKTKTYNVPGKLPVLLKAESPEHGEITWTSGVDEEGKIFGMYRCARANDAYRMEFETVEEALAHRDQMLANEPGEGEVKFFEVADVDLVFKQKNSDGQTVAPNRKKARKMARRMRRHRTGDITQNPDASSQGKAPKGAGASKPTSEVGEV